jgi:adenosylcobyric acid synthase
VRGALMVCGTSSDAGKSHLVTGLCRILHRRGVRVAPFKAQNMSLNSFVTGRGAEIGRAQAAQAFAAGVEPEAAMNPILLKPATETASQVVVMGRPTGHLEAAAYQDHTPALLPTVLAALADLRARFDVVLLEGAGSPAEINLLDRDLVNLRLATEIGASALVVGDIERGGVFASLYGTVALLPPEQRACVGGFVINKLRGDPSLLRDGPALLEARTGIPTLGVLPWIPHLGLDAEDSLALRGGPAHPGGGAAGAAGTSAIDLAGAGVPPALVDVAVVRFPHLANATDVDPLTLEPGVGVRWVEGAAGLGRPDLVVLPGTKATLADLAWLRASGLAAALGRATAPVIGICGGYQVLGRRLVDPLGVEAAPGADADGLGWLPVATTWHPEKVTRRRQGHDDEGRPVAGYEIHHGRVGPAGDPVAPWLVLDGEGEGARAPGPQGQVVLGTSLHGIFESDAVRAAVLSLAAGRPWRSRTRFAAARSAQVDRLADLLEDHLDLAAVERLIETGPEGP